MVKIQAIYHLQDLKAYLVIAVGKDSITMLTELTEDQIDFTPLEVGSDLSFQEIFNKAKDIKGLIHKK